MADFEAVIDLKTGKATTSSGGTGSAKGEAFKGGLFGALLGGLLSSVKQLLDPINAIASLLIFALFPILKPFLILFIKVGLMLYRFLTDALGGLGSKDGGTATAIDEKGNEILTAGDGLKSSLFLIGSIIGGIVAAFLGAPALIIAAVATIGGLLFSKVGSFLADMLLTATQFIDSIFGTDFTQYVEKILDGLANIGNGIWNFLTGILEWDGDKVWDGLMQVFDGIGDVFAGAFELAADMLWETLSASIDGLSTLGSWMWDGLTWVLSKSFDALSGIGSWIKNFIKDSVRSVTSFFGGGSSTKINDGIITPNGNLIRTNPRDYAMFAKNPADLMGGGSGGGNYTININGGLITEEVARDIGKIIMGDLNRGGGF